MAYSIIKSQLVELYIPEGSTDQSRFYFNDQPQLRDKRLLGMSVYCVDDMSVSPQGKTLVSAATLKKSFLVLNCQDMDQPYDFNLPNNLNPPPMGENINFMPLVDLHYVQTGTNPFTRERFFFNGMEMDWSKSYIATGGTIGQDNVSYLLNVFYQAGPRQLR